MSVYLRHSWIVSFLAVVALGVGGCNCGEEGTDSGPPGTDALPGTDMGGTDMGGTDSGTDSGPMPCGNGVLDPGEMCDTGIAAGMPDACPTDCDDAMDCTSDMLQDGGTCDAVCTNTVITTLGLADSCCPAGGNEFNDPDCTPVCDNGVVETGETCDPVAGCPVTCGDMNSCTTDGQVGAAATCDMSCVNVPITGCGAVDSCCPSGCDPGSDADCSTTCDDGVLDAGETCDPMATCPVSCDDADVCTTDVMTGAAATCNVLCTNTPIACGASGSDGCCPAGCNANVDADCPPVCGNGVLEGTEGCDDGNTTAGDGCDDVCQPELPTVFRADTAALRDPHALASIPIIGCTDVTDMIPAMLAPSLNEELDNAISMDGDGDGLLDLSLLVLFRPLDQVGAGGNMEFGAGECTAPAATTTCDLIPGEPLIPTTYTNMTSGTCLEAVAGTTSGYSPGMNTTTAPPDCWVSAPFTFDLDLAGITVPLQDVQVAANYDATPATTLSSGLLRGFILEADADMVMIDLPIIGMVPLSSLLPGGDGNCDADDPGTACPATLLGDMDCHNGDRGWWFYLDFTAVEVTYVGL